MSFLESLSRFNLAVLALVPMVLLVAHVIPYLVDQHRIRSQGIVGPFWAKHTDAWLGWTAARGRRSEVIHEQHQNYGPIVRLAPNHVSINDPEAVQIIYGHGTGTLKSDFYDAFVSIRRGIFSTRLRQEHARKRRFVSHVFSQKSLNAFEPHVRAHVAELIHRWGRLCSATAKGVANGDDGEGGWTARDGRIWFDCLPWFNYLAFDIIGDLAFGFSFGMVDSGEDAVPVALDQKKAMEDYAQDLPSAISERPTFVDIPAVQIVNDRGDYNASIAVLPPWWRPLVARFVPWYARRAKAVRQVAGIAVAAVSRRLAGETLRTDLLSKLQEGKDEDGQPLGREELTAEALTLLIAGSDTTSNSACAITFYLARYPAAQEKLQKELDEVLGASSEFDNQNGTDDSAARWDQLKHLPYLEAVINETLRLHTTLGLGLPRVVPQGGLTIRDTFFPEGTVLSVPLYSVHRDKTVWGPDADEFRPERWLDGSRDLAAMHRAFYPFSFGPRACIGRNLAIMELQIIIASVFRRFHLVLDADDTKLETREGVLRKPLACRVGLTRRI